MHAAGLEQGGQSVKDLTVKIASYIAIYIANYIILIILTAAEDLTLK